MTVEGAGTDMNADCASAATRFPLRILESGDASHIMRVSRRYSKRRMQEREDGMS